MTKPDRTRADLGWEREPTRSDLERVFLKLVKRASLPTPEANPRLGPYRVDFLWRSERLVVELDGYAVLRFTYREVTEEPEAVVAALRAHLGLEDA